MRSCEAGAAHGGRSSSTTLPSLNSSSGSGSAGSSGTYSVSSSRALSSKSVFAPAVSSAVTRWRRVIGRDVASVGSLRFEPGAAERPPSADDGLRAAADPKLVREIAAAGDEAAAEAESPEDRDDADFQPGNDSEVEEEYDEGKVVDDERPPFADDEAPVAADPALLQELQEGGDDDAAGDDDYKPGHESDVDEEFQAD